MFSTVKETTGRIWDRLFQRKTAPLKPLAVLRPALFLHIQKCAGTSIVELARKYYQPSIITHGDHAGKRPEDLKNIAFVSGHFGYDFAASFIKDRYSFTFLRNPADRIISYYYYCRSATNPFPVNQLARETDMETFLKKGLGDPMLMTRLWNNQVWQLACGYANPRNLHVSDFAPSELLRLAKNHLSEFSHVGFTETFNDDRRIIFSQLGLPQDEDAQWNKTAERPEVADLPSAVIKLIKALTELDEELYTTAWAMRGQKKSM